MKFRFFKNFIHNNFLNMYALSVVLASIIKKAISPYKTKFLMLDLQV